MSRRDALRLMGATGALAAAAGATGMAGCGGQPPETIVPFSQPDRPELTPGKPVFYATSLTRGGAGGAGAGGVGLGVLVESRMGRPIKIEGNPEHPSSLGATDVWAQAAVLDLYDPERLEAPRRGGMVTSWQAVEAELASVRQRLGAAGGVGETAGGGLRILTGRISSPTLLAELGRTLARFPGARWHEHEPVSDAGERRGVRMATGRDGQEGRVRYRVGRADVIVSFDDDFLYQRAGSVRHAREFADRRRLRTASSTMNRLYVCEPSPSVTGSNADHRLAAGRSRVEALLRALARELGVYSPSGGAQDGLSEAERAWLAGAAEDLRQAGQGGLVCVGYALSAPAHALGLAINQQLGALGRTVEVVAAEDRPRDPAGEGGVIEPRDLAELVEAMRAGEVGALVVIGSNPVYTAPADLDFAAALAAVETTVCLSLREDETAHACRWRLPASHELEAWGDARCELGIASVQQPLVAPLHESRSALELLAMLRGDVAVSGYEMVRGYWRGRVESREERGERGEVRDQRSEIGERGQSGEFEVWWRGALLRGFIEGTEAAALDVEVALPDEVAPGGADARAEAAQTGAFELSLRPDDRVLDGSLSGNVWLQELPRTHSTLTWDNAALVAPADARALGVASEDLVELALDGRSVQAPVLITPGQAPGCVTLALGFGRRAGAGAATGRGADAYRLRTQKRPWHAPGLQIRKTGGRRRLALRQRHFEPEDRGVLRAGTLGAFRRDPGSVARSPLASEQVSGTEALASEQVSGTEALASEQVSGTEALTSEQVSGTEALASEQVSGTEALTSEQVSGTERRVPLTLFEDRPMEGHQWGMSIDLTACIGCSACTIACQAENNIPVVGPEEVRRGRAMHWIRVDRYHTGPEHSPQFHHQPVPCMHCERAPCEIVCPVGATQHSHDGLNDMIYNRCIGTRYCSNNCPYKVRRFNFLHYTKDIGPLRALGQNPDVTVRTRGVIEKCTYCVQRIRAAGIEARKEGRPIRDGEVVTACQAVCPTGAIVFGDVADLESAVSKLKALPHDYAMLEELNTRPRTTYLAAVRNPRQDFAERQASAGTTPSGAGLQPAGDGLPMRQSSHASQEGA